MAGDGLDQAALDRAVALEDHRLRAPIAIRAGAQSAMLAAWNGRLVEGGDELATLRRRCIEHGEESELFFVSFHAAIAAIWRADFAAAAAAVEDANTRAPQLDGDVPRYVALVTRALLGVHTGDVDSARHDAEQALAAGVRSGAANLSQWPVMALGFLDVSLGNYAAALDTLAPLLARLENTPRATEIIAAWFLPDAVEAQIGLGHLTEAEPWIARLEHNGRRLDRPWMLAVGTRCRAMLLGADGDLDGGVRAAEEAMLHHHRVHMPFEQARTQLLLGQLQRRQRRQEVAARSIRLAQNTFEHLGTPVWAQRARNQLLQTNLGPRDAATLTPSEQRVAELAATGMTNRDVAAALFISPKTVEANLARVYRKLGIRSRAELGASMGARKPERTVPDLPRAEP